MSDVSPYGVHQHAAPGAVRQHALVGEPIDHQTVNQVGASPATFSTAPYGKPKKRTLCANPKCANWPKYGSEWCRWHEPAATA